MKKNTSWGPDPKHPFSSVFPSTSPKGLYDAILMEAGFDNSVFLYNPGWPEFTVILLPQDHIFWDIV